MVPHPPRFSRKALPQPAVSPHTGPQPGLGRAEGPDPEPAADESPGAAALERPARRPPSPPEPVRRPPRAAEPSFEMRFETEPPPVLLEAARAHGATGPASLAPARRAGGAAMDDPTPKPAPWRNAEGPEAVRRLLDVRRCSASAESRPRADGPSDTRLVVALEVDLADREGGPWVQYEIVLLLHRRAAACARVVLYDERAKELVRVFEQDLTSSTIARVRGGFPLSGECELWCGAALLDDGDARGEAFAWIGPRSGQRSSGREDRAASITVKGAGHAGHGPGLRTEAKIDRTGRPPGRSE